MNRQDETIRILLAEDSIADAGLAQREIRKVLESCVFHQVETREDFLNEIREFAPDLIISDYRMPRFDGLSALKLALDCAPFIPVIILTGAMNEDTAVECMKAGAADYVIKEHIKRLGQAVLHALDEKQLRYERHRTAEALRESEERYRTLVHTLPDAVMVVNPEGIATYVSPLVVQLFGYTPDDDILKRNILTLVHESDRLRVLKSLENTLKVGTVKNEEFLLTKKDGSTFFGEVSGSCLRNAQGQVIEIIAIVRDISERKKAQDNLRASEALYKARTKELEMLFSLSTSLRQAQSAQDMLPILLNEIQRILEVDTASFIEFDHQEDKFKFVLSTGSIQIEPGWTFKSDQGFCARVLQERQPCATEDYGSEPNRISHPPFFDQFGPAAFVPLQSEEHLLGILMAARRRETEREIFLPEEIRLLAAMGEMAGNALRRARLFEDVQSHLARTKALHDIQLAVANSFDLQFTLNVALEIAIKILGADLAAILLTNSQTTRLDFATIKGSGNLTLMKDHFQRHNHPLAIQTIRNREMLKILDLGKFEGEFPNLPDIIRKEFVTYLGIPLISKGKIMGVLEIYNRTLHQYNTEEEEFLHSLSGQMAVAIDNLSLFTDLQCTNLQLSQAYDATIEGLTRALDLRDKETEGHTRRVIDLTVELAQAAGISEENLVHIRRGAFLHDMGKMGVPDSILLKPDKLNDEEWVIMRRHPQYAYDMLFPIEYLRPALEIPYCHHEKWDGTGYPRGLKGEEIPLSARIFAVVDVWDAVTNERPYRRAWSREEAQRYIQEESGKHFDPSVVVAFLNIISNHNP